MKIEKKEYIKTCKYLLGVKKLKKKTLKFKIIKRRKSIRHRHLITGLIKGCMSDYKLLDSITPLSDYSLMNPDLFINYGSSTNFLPNDLKLNLVDSRYSWFNGKLMTHRSLGSNINASVRLDNLNLLDSNARDIVYQQSYIYYPLRYSVPFNKPVSDCKGTYSRHSGLYYSIQSLINYL